jgi:hypothetical protein
MNKHLVDLEKWRSLTIYDDAAFWFLLCFVVFAVAVWAWESSDDL